MNPSSTPTFYIITVHFKDARWIEVQNRYIQRYTAYPHKVIAITSIELEDFTPKHWITIRDNGIESHAKKLNIAGDFVSQMANKNDIIVFLDSDCFPIANWCNQIIKFLSEKKIAAVQRLENLGDLQPHPCFTCMESKSWIELKGDWEPGFKWKNSTGNLVSDVGGNMLGILESKQIGWHPIHRTNTFNPHPIFFGIYGNIIYHHGAGSREKMDRVDTANVKTKKIIQYILSTRQMLFKSWPKFKKLCLSLDQFIYKKISQTRKRERINESLSNHFADRIAANEDVLVIFQPQETSCK